MTPNQKHNRRFMVHLLLISSAIFVLSAGEKLRAERDAEKAPRDYENQVPKTYEQGGRVEIPREAAMEIPEAVQEPVASEKEAATQDTSLQGGLPSSMERFSGEALQEAVSRTMRDSVTEDIVECLNAWWLLDPGIEGHVDLEYVIDETGLKEAAVVDHAEVPFGPLSCFATALYRTAWPGSAEGEVVIAQSIVFSNAQVPIPEEEELGTQEGPQVEALDQAMTQDSGL